MRISLSSILLLLAPACFAEVEYTYTGSSFNSYSGTFSSAVEQNITASIWLAAPLGPNYTEASQVSPLAFSISDGSTTLTNLSPNIVASSTVFYFDTDASGNITAWNMNVVQSTGGGDWIRLLTEGGADNTLACGGGSIGSSCSPTTGSATILYSSSQPGWTESLVSATPEPSAFLLIGVGIVAFFIRRVIPDLPRRRIARSTAVLFGLATTGFGEVVVYTTSNSTSVSGGAAGGAGYVDDYLGSSSIEYYSLGSSTAVVDFSITLNLDNNPQNTVSSALLSYGGSFSPTSSGSDDFSYGSQGSYVTGSYPVYGCGFFGNEVCYYQDTYSSSYSTAGVTSSGYTGPVVLTSISSPSTTWNGSISSGSVDLTTLGFGSDLVNGGTLTLNGYFDVTADLTGVSNSGFNSYNNFEAIYDVAGPATASLQLDEITPEPGTIWLVAGGVLLCLMRQFRAKPARG